MPVKTVAPAIGSTQNRWQFDLVCVWHLILGNNTLLLDPETFHCAVKWGFVEPRQVPRRGSEKLKFIGVEREAIGLKRLKILF